MAAFLVRVQQADKNTKRPFSVRLLCFESRIKGNYLGIGKGSAPYLGSLCPFSLVLRSIKEVCCRSSGQIS
ncbi:hypothetical protein DPM33_20935 [Mesorhizobium hawassense]|uniref:Uncharacterized protein n=1 Tax=Mesorhizobium hawassense TaxID=1209954 RepID=A0A330HQF5_9HYPH|nr:hypothetical protein DPM33_20935 [Mesorhizobium hawassense]